MNLRIPLNIFFASLLAAQLSYAVTVDFTAAEGYVDGDVGTHPNWVALAANVVSTNADGYNGAKGIVTLDTDTTLRDSIYNLPTVLASVGDTMTIKTIFRFTSSGDTVATRWDIFTHSYYDSWSTSALEIRANLCRKPNIANTYDIRIRGNAHDYASTFSGTLLGLPANGIGTTDWLQLTSTLRRGTSESIWEVDVELKNLVSNNVVLAETVGNVGTVVGYYNAVTYYPGFNSGNKDVDLLTASREIDVFESTSSTSGANQPPSFNSDPFSKPNADIAVAYTNSIAGDASDPESDPMTFSKISGPVWLNVATNGTITGIPHSTNTGLNAFSVQVSATGGVDTATMNITVNAAPPPPTGWEAFVTTYNLSGDKFDDADLDEVFDVFEFAHGGDPTNAADVGVPPYVVYSSNDTVSFICLETSHTNPGITYTAEWMDDQLTSTTAVWNTVFDNISTNPGSLPDYNEVSRSISSPASDELFFRNRLFNAPSGNRPNILMIMCDDLGYSDVGFSRDYARVRWGQQTPLPAYDVTTPNIDSLAADGMLFAQAYVPHMFCGPSRMGIMSGRYPHHIGGLDNLPYETADRPSLDTLNAGWGYEPANEIGGIPANETTMATVLQDAGYYTGMIGKWHMGVADFAHPNNRGFDYWYGMLGGGHNYNNINNQGTGTAWLSKTDPTVVNDYQFWLTRNAVEEESPFGAYITDLLSDDAVSFITNAPSDEPFFLFLSYTAPHSPMQAKPSDLQARFGGSGDYGDYTDRQNLVAMMDAVDRGVSNVVEALTAKGILNDTLIVFLSDNGGREAEDEADNNPMKGGKGDAYEGGIRTPMFMHYPGVIPAGTVHDYPMTAYDFYPTFARLAEAAIPAEKVIVGKDIWDDVLTGGNTHTNETLIWVRYLSNGFNVGLRKNDIKATVGNSSGNWTVNNLASNITESANIIGDPAASAVLDEMLADGLVWSTDGVNQLWFNSEVSYTNWVVNGMSNKWDDAFTR